MSKIDLHMHSKFSDDGELSVRELLDRCRGMSMELVSVTDHNSVRSAAEARELSAARNIRVLSGVELDCTYQGGGFHLLGYGFDPACGEFEEIERDILEQEKNAAEEKVRLFRKATGIPISTIEVLAAAGEDGVVTGELVAEVVLGQRDAASYEWLRPYLPGGSKSDMPYVRFYWDFFSPGKAAYVPIRCLSLPDAIGLIHRTGGLAVLAHPGQNLPQGDDAPLARIIAQGIDGVEVFSSYHSPRQQDHFLELARKNHLLITCGSDFHGKNKPNIQIGQHGAGWSDPELLAGLEQRLGKSVTQL